MKVIKDSEYSWELENRELKVNILKKNGAINSFIFKRRNFALWKERIGGLKIHDGLKKIDYSDTDSRVNDITASKISGNELIIHKIYEKADFNITSKFTIFHDSLRWDISLKKLRDIDRTVGIEFFIPLINQDWWFWAPADGTPFILSNTLPERLQFTYTRALWEGWWGRIGIPAVAVYNQKHNVGLTILEPFEQRKPELRFSFNSPVYLRYNTFSTENLEVSNLCLGLRNDADAHASLIFIPHKGDWRPGLGWIFNRYKEYFIPANEKVYAMEGVYGGPPFYAGTPKTKREIPVWKKLNLKWHELHNYFPWYGLYCPEEKNWWNVLKLEKTAGRCKVTPEKIREHINFLHEYDVKVFIYWQASDCYEKYAEDKFPESISKDKDGTPYNAWKLCHLMNPDFNLPWAKHSIRQAEMLLETYPETDGFFIDCLANEKFDFAHDDGITMVDNKRSYTMSFGYKQTLETVCSMCHERNKSTFGNTPVNIEVQKNIDGLMSESLDWLGMVGYLGLAKPVLLLTDYATVERAEASLKACLKYGAFFHPLHFQKTQFMKLYELYLPLIKLLQGKKWVLTAHALNLPYEIDGNIFQRRDGDYLITVLSKEKSALDRDKFCEDTVIETILEDARKIKSAHLLSVDYKGYKHIHLEKTGKRIKINLPRHGAASVILLSSKK